MAISDSSVKPTTIVNADSRFGTTFLSTKYRDHAVAGEVLMDKTTGEIFIKRASDGKIVSFYQNKKMLNELALDLRILLLDNPEFTYPKQNNSAFFVSTNHDLVAMNNETLFNIIDGKNFFMYIDGRNIKFAISKECCGFFCRNTTRDIDKPFIEFLSNHYNQVLKDYKGDDPDLQNESNKLATNPKWEICNTTITYNISIITNTDTDVKFEDITDYICLNEDTCIIFPQNIRDKINEMNESNSISFIAVEITSIRYDKINFMIEYKRVFDNLDVEFNDNYTRLCPDDNRLEIMDINIGNFIDNIDMLGITNVPEIQTIIALLDLAHFKRYNDKLKKLITTDSELVISDYQPDNACLWFKPSIS